MLAIKYAIKAIKILKHHCGVKDTPYKNKNYKFLKNNAVFKFTQNDKRLNYFENEQKEEHSLYIKS